ncbi:unnamed protein product [Phytophthora lilii]|uniref:Unnamed protein product n=1 Tax=Phytophthora lilii TaxID=2077276 RepID=A0A9W6TYH7_9STRA|nr:unnamed protein product [Phytophthora lilii]
MSEINSTEQAPAPSERKGKDKDKKKKLKDEKPKVKKTRRQFREEAKQARSHEVPEISEVKSDTAMDMPDRSDSATSLSPSAIVEMSHLQDEELSSLTYVATTVRYLVENETSGDFYQVRTRQRKQQASLPEHDRHRRSSLVTAQQKLRDGSVKAENWACWAILQRNGEKAVIVMILGIVAGMCWLDALNLHSGKASSSSSVAGHFLCVYSAGANRLRQNLFILIKYPFPP